MVSLADRRILITRAPHQASALADELLRLGAVPILVPTIEIAPPTSFAALDVALGNLTAFDLVIFTSANAVDAFHRRAQLLSLIPKPKRVAVVGPSTARALQAIGLRANLIPPTYTAASLAATLAPEVSRQHILILLPEDPDHSSPGAPSIAALRDGWDANPSPSPLAAALTAAGATVTLAPAYRNRIPAESIAALCHLFSAPENYPNAITFTSASTALNLVALLNAAKLILPESVVRASIGPVTSHALRELNLPPHLEAASATIPALANSLAAYFAR
jgi:uroporphyrinogen-III synthase